MTPREWIALEADLADEERSAWQRTAAICTTLANLHRPKNRRPYRLRDFMPRERRTRKQTVEEQMALMEGLYQSRKAATENG